MGNKLKEKLLADFNGLVEIGKIKHMVDLPNFFTVGEILMIINEVTDKLVNKAYNNRSVR